MSKVVATTESGATYQFKGGLWNHRNSGWNMGWGLPRIFTWDDLTAARVLFSATDDMPGFWNWVREQEQVDPETESEKMIGKSVYVTSRDYWRISTPIVKVEVVEDE